MLHVYSKTSLRRGFFVRTVARRWTELSITYANAPRVSRARVRSGRIRAGRWTTIDVTPFARGKDVVRLALTTASTSTIRLASRESAHPPRLGRYPVSYFAGPAGKKNILPPRRPGAFLGLWPGGPGMTWREARRQLLARESQMRRKFDVIGIHYGAPRGACYYGPPAVPFRQGREAWVDRHGSVPYVSWSPGWTLDEVNAGRADACFRRVARNAKATGIRTFLRVFWEFNDPGAPWYFADQPTTVVSAWRRMVTIFRAEGATKISWVWCAEEGQYRSLAIDQSFEAYPGNRYVDWVCSDGYNRGTADNWCGNFQGWCPFEWIFHTAAACHCGPTRHDSVEVDFRGIKPYMVGETGTNEDPNVPRHKGEWFVAARDAIKARFPGLMALVYVDQDISSVEAGNNWRLDTSRSSLNGFRALARDWYFRTR
jgi:hypothetical protein